MRAVGVVIVILALGFIYVPLGWAMLRWAWTTVGAFWGLW